MAKEIVGDSALPALASCPDTSTNIVKSWIGRQFEPSTVVLAWLSIYVTESLLCKDVAKWTLPTLNVQISTTLLSSTV